MAVIQKEPYSQRRLTVLAEGTMSRVDVGYQFAIDADGISFTIQGNSHKFHVTLNVKEFEKLVNMLGLLYQEQEKKKAKKRKKLEPKRRQP